MNTWPQDNGPRGAYQPIAASCGTYVLIQRAQTRQRLTIGRLGELVLCPGFYVYVGSALGAGGLAARVQRHLGPVHTLHWHIDYLRQATEPCEIWYTLDAVRHEHAWAAILGEMPGASAPLLGFGASDCACASHLFYFASMPSLSAFRCTVATCTPGVQVLQWQLRSVSSGDARSAPTPP